MLFRNAAFSYAWLNTIKKDFEKEIAKRAKSNHQHRTVYSAGLEGPPRQTLHQAIFECAGQRLEIDTDERVSLV